MNGCVWELNCTEEVRTAGDEAMLCIWHYYTFKLFPCFRLVKTKRTIHHNQLLFTKERIFVILNQWHQKCSPLQIIEPRTSKWRQKCSLLQIIEPLTEKTWRRDCVIFGKQKNKERNGEIFWIYTLKYFKWIIKRLVNSAFVLYEEFCRVLSTSAFGLCG